MSSRRRRSSSLPIPDLSSAGAGETGSATIPTRRRRRSHPVDRLKRRLQAMAFGFALFAAAGALLALIITEMGDGAGREDASPQPAVAVARPSPAAQGDHSVPVVTCPGAEKSAGHPAFAAACGDTRALKDLLAKPGAGNAVDPRPEFAGRTPVHHAAQRGDTGMLTILLAAGADPNAADTAGDTPLHLVATTPQLREPEFVARKLLNGGARLDLANKRGLTPIQELELHQHRLLHHQNLAKVLFQAERENQLAQWLAPSVPAGERPLYLPNPEPPNETTVEIDTALGRVRLPVDPPAPGQTIKAP